MKCTGLRRRQRWLGSRHKNYLQFTKESNAECRQEAAVYRAHSKVIRPTLRQTRS